MEANLFGKLLTAVLMMGVFFYLLFLRPWRPRRLWQRRVPSVDILFLIALAMGFSSIYSESPYERAAVRVVALTELPETLWQVDERIHFMQELPERVWDNLTERLGWGSDEPEPTPVVPDPTWISDAVLPAVAGVVEMLLRSFVYGGSLMLMAVCQATRLAVGVKRFVSNQRGQSGQSALEERVAKLEQTIATLELQPVEGH